MVGVLIVTLTLFSFRHSNKVANQECICHPLYPQWFRIFCFPEMKIIKLIFLLIFNIDINRPLTSVTRVPKFE